MKRKNSTTSATTTKKPTQKITTIESTKIVAPEDLSIEEEEPNKDKGEEVMPGKFSLKKNKNYGIITI